MRQAILGSELFEDARTYGGSEFLSRVSYSSDNFESRVFQGEIFSEEEVLVPL
jgi:hypothetical protein